MESKRFFRLMLGAKSVHAADCFQGNFIGADFGIDQDLTENLSEEMREFNQKYRPIWLEKNPGKSKVAAGLSCGALWNISKGFRTGDVVLCPDGSGVYRVGEITSDYQYQPGGVLPHRRMVHWFDKTISRSDLSKPLRNSAGSIGTVSDLTKYADELEPLIEGPICRNVSRTLLQVRGWLRGCS